MYNLFVKKYNEKISTQNRAELLLNERTPKTKMGNDSICGIVEVDSTEWAGLSLAGGTATLPVKRHGKKDSDGRRQVK